MKKLIFSGILLSSVSFISCNEGHSNASETTKTEQSKISKNNKIGACLLKNNKTPQNLLKESDVRTITGFIDSKMTINDKDNGIVPFLYIYKFDNKRLQTFGNYKTKIADDDRVGVGSIEKMDLKTFKEKHGVIHDQDLNNAKNELDKVVDGKSSDKRADEALEKLEELGVSKNTTKKVGSSIMDIMKVVSEAYEVVEGLGDYAVYNSVNKAVYVFVDGVHFEVRMDISDDMNVNKSKAIEAARIVLNACN